MKIFALTVIGAVLVFIFVIIIRSEHYGARVVSKSEYAKFERANKNQYSEIKEYFAQKIEKKTGRKPEKIGVWVSNMGYGAYIIDVYYRYERVWYRIGVGSNHKWMTPEIYNWAESLFHY